MNKTPVGEVTLSLPSSEFVDRYLISILKLSKFKQAGKSSTAHLENWIDKHQDAYMKIINHSDKVEDACAQLTKVHSQLWDLEDLVRSPEASEMAFFAKTAKKIFSLNTERHKLKHTIDTELPALSFGPRLYDKGVE